jgi:predicted kinase
MLIVICGPIASGKSTLARAVALLFRHQGVEAAAIDLDLVYEMLEGDGALKASPSTWRRARRAAAALTDALLEDGVRVVVEGDFLTAQERAEFGSALCSPVVPLFVTVHVPVDIALQRVEADPTRGLSRDPGFLRRHYDGVQEALRNRPATDLLVDTSSIGCEEAARTIVEWASARADATRS